MSKMREAFERWFYASKYAQVILPTESNKQIAWDGYQAAIAAVKEGGPVAWMLHDGEIWSTPVCPYKDERGTGLYKLPDDLT